MFFQGLPKLKPGFLHGRQVCAAFTWLMFALAGGPALAAPADCAEPPRMQEPRIILSVYDGSRELSPRETRIHRFLEFPLNHLGYSLRYIDIAEASPQALAAEDVAGLVSWFDAPLPPGTGFFEWAAQLRQDCGGGVRQIAFGDPGLPESGTVTPVQAAYLDNLGLRLQGGDRIAGALASVSAADDAMIGLETDFTIEPGRYRGFRQTGSGRSFLRIRFGSDGDSPETDLVVIGPRGGYVHQSAAVIFDPRLPGALWCLDPFAFFEAVLGPRQGPVPDVTTLVGRRLYFSTVGSDGWLTPMPARQFDEEPKLGAEMLLDHLIQPFADLPATVAVLTGDLDPDVGGRDALRGRAVAEAVFDLPNVQVATMGASHIRTWDYFASYDPATEGQMIDRLRAGSASEGRSGGLVTAAMRGLAGAFAGRDPVMAARVPDAPRDYTRDAFSLAAEIPLALSFARDLAPPGKPAPVLLWSGDARPFAAAVAAAKSAGAPAMGGGGGVYNRFSPTLAGLAPLSVPVGDDLQVYDALSSDAAYTNFWAEPSHGFFDLADTLEWTDRPRRLKPFHLNFSAQSALVPGTRQAVRAMLQRARDAEVVPVTAGTYVAMVDGFRTFRAERIAPMAWRILHRQALTTVRFDRAAGLALDLDASPGTLGARRKGDVLYVALNPAAAEPEIRLVRSTDPGGMHRASAAIGLSESRLPVLDLVRDGCRTRLVVQGGIGGRMSLFGPSAMAFDAEVTPGGAAPSGAIRVISGPDGRIDLQLPDAPGQTVALVLTGGC